MALVNLGKNKVLLLGIGDYGASNDVDTEIKTMALGSCIAVVLLDPRTRTVGMVHVALPDSHIQHTRRTFKPGYFADTGIRILLEEMKRFGSCGILSQMYIKLAGGARVIKAEGIMDIGRRNIEAMKQIMVENRVKPVAHDLAGVISRTVSVEVKTGIVRLSCPGRDDWFL